MKPNYFVGTQRKTPKKKATKLSSDDPIFELRLCDDSEDGEVYDQDWDDEGFSMPFEEDDPNPRSRGARLSTKDWLMRIGQMPSSV